VYLKKEAEGLDFSPYPGELGKRIYDNVSKEAFELWKRHQTMLVNENRLNLADARARQYLARQMERFFFGGGRRPAGGVCAAGARPVLTGNVARVFDPRAAAVIYSPRPTNHWSHNHGNASGTAGTKGRARKADRRNPAPGTQ
jgi:Fe-S cluster biosynthesis and repair protein YggX